MTDNEVTHVDSPHASTARATGGQAYEKEQEIVACLQALDFLTDRAMLSASESPSEAWLRDDIRTRARTIRRGLLKVNH